MRKRLFAAIPLAALAIAVLALAIASTASAGGRPLSADLSGSNEVPPVSTGDPDGSGTADLTLNQGQGEICLQIEVQNIAAPILQHIHRGAAGVNGPVVVDFTSLLSQGGDGCVSADPRAGQGDPAEPGGLLLQRAHRGLPRRCGARAALEVTHSRCAGRVPPARRPAHGSMYARRHECLRRRNRVPGGRRARRPAARHGARDRAGPGRGRDPLRPARAAGPARACVTRRTSGSMSARSRAGRRCLRRRSAAC